MVSTSERQGTLEFLVSRFRQQPQSDQQRTSVLDNIFSHLSESDRFFAFKLGWNSNFSDPTATNSSFTVGKFGPTVTTMLNGGARQITYYPVFKTLSSPYDYWKYSTWPSTATLCLCLLRSCPVHPLLSRSLARVPHSSSDPAPLPLVIHQRSSTQWTEDARIASAVSAVGGFLLGGLIVVCYKAKSKRTISRW